MNKKQRIHNAARNQAAQILARISGIDLESAHRLTCSDTTQLAQIPLPFNPKEAYKDWAGGILKQLHSKLLERDLFPQPMEITMDFHPRGIASIVFRIRSRMISSLITISIHDIIRNKHPWDPNLISDIAVGKLIESLYEYAEELKHGNT